MSISIDEFIDLLDLGEDIAVQVLKDIFTDDWRILVERKSKRRFATSVMTSTTIYTAQSEGTASIAHALETEILALVEMTQSCDVCRGQPYGHLCGHVGFSPSDTAT